MTIPTAPAAAGPYATDGTTTSFPFEYKSFGVGYHAVVKTIGETATTLVYGDDYSVVLNADQNTDPGGTVLISPALPSGATITIYSNVPYEQPVQLPTGGRFYARTVMDALDRIVTLVKQMSSSEGPGAIAGSDRTLRVPDGEVINELPAAADRLNEFVKFDNNGNVTTAPLPGGTTAEDFGAVGDGSADDTAALQALLDHLAANGGVGRIDGEYLINTALTLTDPAKAFTLEGSGDGAVLKLRGVGGAPSAIAILQPVGVVIRNLRVDMGYSVTGFAGSGISMRNPLRCTVEQVSVYDHRNTGIMMFVDVQDTYGYSHIRNCDIDGNNSGQNGVLLEGLRNSSITNTHVRNLSTSGSPCYGLQLKNLCRYSFILGGSAQNCKAGVALAGDTSAEGTGPLYCFVQGTVVKDCLDGVVVGKTTNSFVQVIADMANSPAGGYALNIAGYNVGFRSEVSIYNVQTGRTGVRVSSDDSQVHIPVADGFGSYLVELAGGVNRARVTVDNIVGSTYYALHNIILDNSGQADNEFLCLRDLPVSGLSSGGSYMRFPATGQQTWISYAFSGDAFTFRQNGTDRYIFNPDQFQPNPDNTLTLGSAARRWTTVYATTGAINTSDSRDKSHIADMENRVLDAWAAVRWVQFKHSDAVKAKGSKARLHFGLLAQEVESVFAAAGLNAFDLGVLCYDEWEDPDTKKKKNRYGLRYDEAFALEAALTRRTLARLTAPA